MQYDFLRGCGITGENDNSVFDVEFMSCVIDKADNLKVIDSDSHFSKFTGVHPSKIKQGKLYLHDILIPQDRETIMRALCKKNSPYVYMDFNIKNDEGQLVYVHCTGRNLENSTLCYLTLADVSRSVEKSRELKAQAKEMNHLIDLVTGGVCLFKVNQNMHFEALYMNQACCTFFGTTKQSYNKQAYRLDELIHPDDKSLVFQAVGNSMATKQPIDLEVRIRNHGSNYVWCKMNSAIQRYDKDNCPIFHAIFTNIERIKQGEEEADRQTDLMVKLFKNLPGPLFCARLETPFKLDVVSADFMKLLGFTRKEFFEKYDGDLSNLISPNELSLAAKALEEQSKKGDSAKFTYSIKTRMGQHLVVVDRRKIIDGDNGEKNTVGLLRDITSIRFDGDMGLDF